MKKIEELKLDLLNSINEKENLLEQILILNLSIQNNFSEIFQSLLFQTKFQEAKTIAIEYSSLFSTDYINNLLNITDKISTLTYNNKTNIGKQVIKISGNPFKSKSTVNTIKGIIEHPIIKVPAYIFEEDDSYVELRKCQILEP